MRLKNKNNQNQNWPIIFGLWLIYFCFGYSVSSIAPIVPYITQDLNITYKQMGLILGAWQFTYMYFLGLIIGGGTSQIQKNIISERGLGLPREPKVQGV